MTARVRAGAGEGDTDLAPGHRAVRRVLAVAAFLNLALVGGIGVAGLLTDSSGLVANAIDNASDTAIYAFSYAGEKRGAVWKTRAARISGFMLLFLCVGVLAEVARKFFVGAEPIGAVMIGMTVLAALINLVCIRLLRHVRQHDVSLRAAWTSSINDVISNVGLLAAGGLVAGLERSWPDLVIAIAIALVAAKGGIEILSDARRTAESDRKRASATNVYSTGSQ